MATVRKNCEICQAAFEADPRVGERQRVCRQLACQRERKRRAQQQWVAKNPGYFAGRYPQLKIWLATRPEYLRTYRQVRSSAPTPASGDIQDESTPDFSKHLLAARDIQDEISVKLNKSRQHLEQICLIYKTSCVPVSATLGSA